MFLREFVFLFGCGWVGVLLWYVVFLEVRLFGGLGYYYYEVSGVDCYDVNRNEFYFLVDEEFFVVLEVVLVFNYYFVGGIIVRIRKI